MNILDHQILTKIGTTVKRQEMENIKKIMYKILTSHTTG